ncbi:Inner membrane protein YrbG [Dickeya dianthicola]|uniref:Calcium/sodium antiporter n=1 Tax=Dickeya dianthicola TaxID=204039 RepID=A0AAP2G7Q5_9GAMM|nr:calcium/sodium antiporter [Dickeya dianthicola]ATO31220.1 Inner membrane protein YrbG, predicte calcium/sodium:proton antiporter [Dickeya dianthicola RNS04.9]AYC17222.1 Inner membrane protein YrbG [Dickeya dianthicola]MBI0436317.1 calcium/sodium antiporter [Dickeya dianthicola]MBI0450838.1 calcium/sodium antiporter [Dickeya dianthicola]MBI0452276.1 calcium/sodium antiporter [Dickeya dianthicola]
MLFATVLLIVGLVLLVYGADRLVYGAAVLARTFGVPPMIIGMTIVGMGTSLPELMVSVTAALNHQTDMAVGNVLGSNIANILLILGSAVLIRPLTLHSTLLRQELPPMLVVTLLCGILLHDSVLSRLDGVILLLTAGGCIVLMLRMAHAAQNRGDDSLTREQMAELPRENNQTVALLWLLLGLIILPMSARIVIDNATVIANYFNISELTIGLTVLAVGTSLPELATAVVGTLKKEDDIALGNLIGSNIFNIVIVLGVPALLSPGAVNPLAFARDYWVMLGVSALLTVLCLRQKRRIGQGAGALLLCAFIAYLSVLFLFS